MAALAEIRASASASAERGMQHQAAICYAIGKGRQAEAEAGVRQSLLLLPFGRRAPPDAHALLPCLPCLPCRERLSCLAMQAGVHLPTSLVFPSPATATTTQRPFFFPLPWAHSSLCLWVPLSLSAQTSEPSFPFPSQLRRTALSLFLFPFSFFPFLFSLFFFPLNLSLLQISRFLQSSVLSHLRSLSALFFLSLQ